MKRLFAPILLLALAPGLSGCVAAALPLASGLLMGKDGLEAGRDGKDAGARTQAPPEADTRDSAMPADAPLAALSPADAPGIAEADLAGAQVASLAPFAEMPAPSGYAPPDDDAFAGLFAKVTAVAQADPFSDEKRKSAFLADPAGLSPERADCAFAQTAVLVDLDPGDGEAPLGEDVAAPDQLARVLATLRAQEVAVLWLSRHTAVRAGAVRRALLRTGLDPRGQDELYLVRYEDETKATRRADAAKDFCIVAILGDEKRDFDELFAFLKDPDAAFALDPLMGEAWFLAPAPLTSSSSQSEQG
ncbi:MAG: hypothetical protein CL808_07230 [Citromicrobium sp.]|nr:hypothetical protein [Citromicrobium sp.]